MARLGSRLRFRSHSHPEPSNTTMHVIGIVPSRKSMWDIVPVVVTGAVVPTVTVTGWAALPLICTEELERPQVGAGFTAGAMLQLSLTEPLNDSRGVTAKLNFALCPARMVSEVDVPEAAPMLKSGGGGAMPKPDRAAVCGLPGPVSLTAILAVRSPPALGVNVKLTVQLPEGDKEFPQLLVSLKSELSAPTMLMPLRFKEPFPVFTSVTTAGALLVPTARGGAKLVRLGYGVRKGPFTPEPLRGIARGLILVLSVIVMEPDFKPVAVGT